MDICGSCKEQTKKSRREIPHELLYKVEDRRFFKGSSARGYEEQDYQCQACLAKFTWSNNRNDQPWTLWQG